MDKEKLQKILSEHQLWLEGKNGKRANLSRANLSGANFSEANLSRANLSGADLSRANLSEANLSEANLGGANLSEADLSGAGLSRANLSEADLSWANLSGADLIVMQVASYTAYIQPTHTRIGCKYKPNSAWLALRPDQAEELETGTGKIWSQFSPVLKAAIVALEKKE